MNPNNQIIEFFENNGIIVFDENMVIENIEIIENPENNHVNEPVVLNLGPPPVLQRHNPPVYFGEEEELLADAPFQEEMVLPPPPALSRNINTPLLDSEWRDVELLPPPASVEDDDDFDEFDMPEGVEYISITISKYEDKEQEKDK